MTLTTSPVTGEWTAKDLLAHIAAWDDLYRARVELALADKQSEISPLDADAVNAQLYWERADWGLQQALDALLSSRIAYLDTLSRATDEDILAPIRLQWGRRSILLWTRWRYRHDAEHARDLSRWRRRERLDSVPGPTSVLLAIARAARKELLTVITVIPVEERPHIPLRAGTLEDAFRAMASHASDGTAWLGIWHAVHRDHQRLLQNIERTATGPLPRATYAEVLQRTSADRRLAAEIRPSRKRR